MGRGGKRRRKGGEEREGKDEGGGRGIGREIRRYI